MSKIKGINCSVYKGTNKVAGMSSVTLDFGGTEEHDVTEFGSLTKMVETGLKTNPTFSCSGFYETADTTGQDMLEDAREEGTHLTDLRFYIGSDIYVVCQTAGYKSPTKTTGASTTAGYSTIKSHKVDADVSGMGKTSFDGTVSGQFVKVAA